MRRASSFSIEPKDSKESVEPKELVLTLFGVDKNLFLKV